MAAINEAGNPPTRPGRLPPAGVILAAFVAGAVPFAQIAARLSGGVDLRKVGSGTVSGTSLYRVAGFGPLAVAGVLDVAKGAVGPALAGPGRPLVSAAAGGAAVAGHNWSPLLKGAGGRGISPAMGALLVRCWPGTVVLALGLGLGRLARATAPGCLAAYLALVPVLGRTRGQAGRWAGTAILVPMLVKRLLGNHLPVRWSNEIVWSRLVHDRDPGATPSEGDRP